MTPPRCLVRGSLSESITATSDHFLLSHSFKTTTSIFTVGRLPAFANSQSQCPTVKNLVRAGETIFSTKYERRAGGKGANQAVAIAKAGGRVDLLGSVGEDGIWLIQYLQAIGVNTDNVSVVEVSTVESVWFLSHDFEKRRHIQGAL